VSKWLKVRRERFKKKKTKKIEKMKQIIIVVGFLFCFASARADDHLRPRYHVMPPSGWMNDPNGPFEQNNRYHLFYQFNPSAPVWGDIHWGHVTSTDMVYWQRLPIALAPGPSQYDSAGVWSGSTSFQRRETPMLVYTGVSSNLSTGIDGFQFNEVQAYAVPANLSDPMLVDWVKPTDVNPLIGEPSPMGNLSAGFRDPTTVWRNVGSDARDWMLLGSGVQGVGGNVLLYSCDDGGQLLRWRYERVLLAEPLDVPGGLGAPVANVWECPDFYEARVVGNGSSSGGGGERVHVLKISSDPQRYDFWLSGSFVAPCKFVPTRRAAVDGGDFYASKSFWDGAKRRRVLFGWLPEADSGDAQQARGWAGAQSLPRTVVATRDGHLLQAPIVELSALRAGNQRYARTIEFAPSPSHMHEMISPSGGALELLVNMSNIDGAVREYGIDVLADASHSIFTRVAIRCGGNNERTLVVDRSKSSASSGVDRSEQSAPMLVDLEPSLATLHIFVDGSIVEVFADSGQAVITSRVYPDSAAQQHLFVFANATAQSPPAIAFQLEIYELSSIWQ
jgi:beta-fructofuranosidase